MSYMQVHVSGCSTQTRCLYQLACDESFSMQTYHNLPKSLENVEQVMVASRLLQVAYKQCSCSFGVKFINALIQWPELILTLSL